MTGVPSERTTYTPLKFNIAPEKLTSQKEIHLPTTIFSGVMLNFSGVAIVSVDRVINENPRISLEDNRSKA